MGGGGGGEAGEVENWNTGSELVHVVSDYFEDIVFYVNLLLLILQNRTTSNKVAVVFFTNWGWGSCNKLK